MKRRLSALSVSAAALLTAAPLLAGCATGAHPGAAAVVGGERITVSQVQSHVRAVRAAQRALPNADELIAASSSLSRETVNLLVHLRVVERAAKEHGVHVSRSEVQRERAMTARSVGGSQALRAALVSPQQPVPLTSDQFDAVLRSQLLIRGIAEAVGAEASDAGRQKVGRVLTDTARDLGVTVNPRYGTWDARQVALVDLELPWLRDSTAGGAPATLDG